MSDIARFTEWLSYRPSWDLIALALATDYLSGLEVSALHIIGRSAINSNVVLGGFWTGTRHSSNNQARTDFPNGLENDWLADSSGCVFPLRDRGIVVGSLRIEFDKAIDQAKKDEVVRNILSFCAPISLFLSFQHDLKHPDMSSNQSNQLQRDSEAGHLTQRQVMILRGMVEGKTNHELASEMGFSVSTIRHETMRIYQALAVSDRKEAAKKALRLSLL